MKRFFCSTCGRMRRTQKWPLVIENVHSERPELRVGQCNWHVNPSSHRIHRTQVQITHSVNELVPLKKVAGKRGRGK